MIKVGLKGLAKFMTSNASRQRKVIRDYKYPDPEGYAQAGYYRDARDLIASYRRKGCEPSWLHDQALKLDALAAQAGGRVKTRFKHNARILREYSRYFAKKRFEVLPNVKLKLVFGGVEVSVVPDLRVKERKSEKIIKLEFSKEEPDDRIIKIIGQAMFEAQIKSGMGFEELSGALHGHTSRQDTQRGKSWFTFAQ